MAERLHRSRDDRMLAGVAGGLAEMWDADPALVRIVWALLVIFTGGVALLVYIVMAVVVPEEDDMWQPQPPGSPPSAGGAGEPGASGEPGEAVTTGGPAPAGPVTAGSGWVTPPRTSRQLRAEARAARRAERRARGYGTSGGVVIGAFLVLLGVFFLARQYLPNLDVNWFWPLVLVAIGVIVLVSAVGRGPDSGDRG